MGRSSLQIVAVFNVPGKLQEIKSIGKLVVIVKQSVWTLRKSRSAMCLTRICQQFKGAGKYA